MGVLLVRRAGKTGDWASYLEEFPERRQARCMGKYKGEGLLRWGRSRGRRPCERCAGHSASKSGLLKEKLQRQLVEQEVLPLVRVPSLSTAFRRRTTSRWARAETVQLVVVRRVAASMVVGLPNRLLVTQDSTDPWRS